jgi:hypothetical protein
VPAVAIVSRHHGSHLFEDGRLRERDPAEVSGRDLEQHAVGDRRYGGCAWLARQQ